MMFGLTVSYVNGYFLGANDRYGSIIKRSSAFDVLSALNYKNLNTDYSKLAITSKAYRFYIKVNNTGQSVSDELIVFNLTKIGYFDIDSGSVRIYDGNTTLDYERKSEEYRFKFDFNSEETKVFTVWFDDDSNFTYPTVSLGNTTDNLSEVIFPPISVKLLSYDGMTNLNEYNYTQLKNDMGIDEDFHIVLPGGLDFGPPIPSNTDVYSLQNSFLYQNRSGHIKNNNMVIKVW